MHVGGSPSILPLLRTPQLLRRFVPNRTLTAVD